MSTIYRRATYVLRSSPIYVKASYGGRVENFAISQSQVQYYLDNFFDVEHIDAPVENAQTHVLPLNHPLVSKAVRSFVIEKAGFLDSPDLIIDGLPEFE